LLKPFSNTKTALKTAEVPQFSKVSNNVFLTIVLSKMVLLKNIASKKRLLTMSLVVIL
jgi:hypothetical protein